MNKNEAIIKLNRIAKGRFFNMGYVSDVPLTAKAKKEGVIVTKKTYGTFRVGINRLNTKAIKNKMAQGYIPQARKWGEYLDGSDRILTHTDKEGQTKFYVVLHSTPNHSKVKYYLNGNPIKKDVLASTGYVQNSYFNKLSEKPDTITVNLANISFIDKQGD